LTYRIAVESLKMYRPTRDVFAACSVVPFVVVLVTAVTVDAVGATKATPARRCCLPWRHR
jgi:hypothetical protein